MFWKNHKEWLIVLIYFAIIGLAYYFGIRKMHEDIDVKKSKIIEIEATQKKERERISQLSSLREDYEFVLESEGRIPSFLKEEAAVELYNEIDLIEKETGNQVDFIVISPPDIFPAKSKNSPKDGDTIGGSLPVKDVLQLQIKTKGTFSGIMNFINKLENEKYLLDIVSFKMQAIEKVKSSQVRPVLTADNQESSAPQEEVQDEIEAMFNVVFYTQK